jgi:1-aminocyclopropane-1-carboxylate deaminase
MLVRLRQLERSLAEAPIEQVRHSLLDQTGLMLWVKREDLLHPVISGNKWRKLKFNLRHALELEYDHVISMGGPWSNHLHALAWTGHQLGIKTTGIIRGEKTSSQTPTLKEMQSWGMHLESVDRTRFRELRNFKNFDDEPGKTFDGYWLTEGGANTLAMQGVAELVAEIPAQFDTIALACGTGTTLAGIAHCIAPDKQALGFSALKGANFLNQEVTQLLVSAGDKQRENWTINFDYHFGGFAKTDQKLLDFIVDFEDQTGIPLEPVYTGKLMYGIFDLIKQDYFKPDQKIITLHTGGLQGNRGFDI